MQPLHWHGYPISLLVSVHSVNTDCKVSVWSHWSKCKGRCGRGTRSRTRVVLQRPKGKGKYCPVLVRWRKCKLPKCADDMIFGEDLAINLLPWSQRFFAKRRKNPLVSVVLNLTSMQLTAVWFPRLVVSVCLCLVGWLSGWLAVWPGCLVSWLSGCLAQLSGQLAVWLAGCLAGWLSFWLSVCLAACLPVCLSACLAACLPVCLSACLPVWPSCLAVWLAVWLAGWLAGWLVCHIYFLLTGDCIASEWTPWTQCTKSCNRGKMFRFRKIERQKDSDGSMCKQTLKEKKRCNTQKCLG